MESAILISIGLITVLISQTIENNLLNVINIIIGGTMLGYGLSLLAC